MQVTDDAPQIRPSSTKHQTALDRLLAISVTYKKEMHEPKEYQEHDSAQEYVKFENSQSSFSLEALKIFTVFLPACLAAYSA